MNAGRMAVHTEVLSRLLNKKMITYLTSSALRLVGTPQNSTRFKFSANYGGAKGA